MFININKVRVEQYPSFTEEELMNEIDNLQFDDYYTIDKYIIPLLHDKRNIHIAEGMVFDRYHTYGDCR